MAEGSGGSAAEQVHTRFSFEVRVRIEVAIRVGTSPDEELQVVPIVGGPDLTGTVLSHGGDGYTTRGHRAARPVPGPG